MLLGAAEKPPEAPSNLYTCYTDVNNTCILSQNSKKTQGFAQFCKHSDATFRMTAARPPQPAGSGLESDLAASAS